jgi:hypothetical protein
MAKLAALNHWQRMIVLLALGTATALAVWCLVWVAWTVRPLLAAAAAFAVVGWLIVALRRHRSRTDWHEEEWIGS